MSIRCVIGLGNPGSEYAETRHNIGFMVIEGLGAKYRAKLKPGKGSFYLGKANIKGDIVLMAVPTTYMNRSGIAVRRIVELEGLKPEEILVVLDDFDLPFGWLRIRKSGSAGSHNGLTDIIERLGTKDIPRLRVGIGEPPANIDPADFVLSRFSPEERKDLPNVIADCMNAVEIAVRDGIDRAMNIHNRKKDEEANGSKGKGPTTEE